jgi:hypothetical protein
MYNSKLINIYNSFSIKNKRKLRKWINSDFVNKNEEVISFFEFIDSRKVITEKSVTKLKAYQYIYPDSPYNDLRIRHLMWMTTEIFESFIVYLQTQNNELIKNQMLAKYYAEIQLIKPANKVLENYILKSDFLSECKIEDYGNLYDAGLLFYDINSTYDRTISHGFEQTIQALSMHSIVECLKSVCIADSIEKVTEIKISHPLLPAILQMLPNSELLKIPAIYIYYNTYLLLTNEDERAFEEVVKSIIKNEHLFNRIELKRIYRLALNFCVKKHNQNRIEYTQKAFELYNHTIEKGILIEGNEISRFVFTNVVTMGIKIKELEKVEKFIEQYNHLIHPDYRTNTYDFNKSKLQYAKKEYKNALKILLTNEFKDEIWNLNAKFMTLKILFETDDLDSFKTYLTTFKKYVKRRKNIGYHKTYFTEVCQALQTLYDKRIKPDKYKDYKFPTDTPDFAWFEKLNASIK